MDSFEFFRFGYLILVFISLVDRRGYVVVVFLIFMMVLKYFEGFIFRFRWKRFLFIIFKGW